MERGVQETFGVGRCELGPQWASFSGNGAHREYNLAGSTFQKFILRVMIVFIACEVVMTSWSRD